MPNQSSPQPADAVHEELLRLLAHQGSRVPYPMLLVAALLALMAVQGGAWPWVALWLLAMAGALLLRGRALKQLASRADLPLRQRMRRAVALNALLGAVLALSLGFAPGLNEHERMVQTILLLGSCAAAVAASMGHAILLGAFVGPVLLALSASWAGLSSSWLDDGLALLILVFGLILLDLARDSHRSFIQALQARVQQAQSNQQLRIALRQAEQAMQAKTRFLASASHDLRQPMHTLSLYGAALMRRPLDPLSAEIGRNLNLALQVLAAQMDALLDISKLDAQQVAVHAKLFNLAPWLQRLAREMMPAAHLKGLVLTLDCPPQCLVETDPLLLDRVLRNLLDNAIKYTSRGQVHLQVTADGELWRLAVRDSGAGIAPADQARVFEEFYQLGNAERDRSRGLGLGLSIVTRLVDLLDISLTLDSAPGVGSCFSLGLAMAEGMAPSPPGAPDADEATDDFRGLRVLVIDDEVQVREAMRALLREHGCEVMGAGSVREALVQCLKLPPDLVLCDLHLRNQEDGLAALRALHGPLPGLRAVLISGDTTPEALRQAEAAALLLLHKPLQESALLEVLRSAVRSGTKVQ